MFSSIYLNFRDFNFLVRSFMGKGSQQNESAGRISYQGLVAGHAATKLLEPPTQNWGF